MPLAVRCAMENTINGTLALCILHHFDKVTSQAPTEGHHAVLDSLMALRYNPHRTLAEVPSKMPCLTKLAAARQKQGWRLYLLI